MTADQFSVRARLLRWALAVYPASYGPGARAEVAHHAERHIAGAGRLAGLREVADVAGHGARVRLGLVSHRPPGRALATAAPLAAMLAGTFAAWHLWAFVRIVRGGGLDSFGPSGARTVAVTVLMLAPAVLMMLAVLAGQRTTARVLALVAATATPLFAALFQPVLCDYQVVLIAFNALVLLAAPPDHTSHQGRALPWTVALSITAGDVIVASAGGQLGDWAAGTAFYFVAPVVTGAAVASTARTVRNAASATAVLAGPPLLGPLLLDMGPNHRALVLLPVVLFTAGYAIAYVTVGLTTRIAHRPGPQHP